MRRQYEKKGWSPNKIERAVQDHKKAIQHHRVESFEGLRPDIRELIADLTMKSGSTAVLVHFYSSDIKKERFNIEIGETASPDELLSGNVKLFEDRLLWVRAH